jgi:hypothetical protein
MPVKKADDAPDWAFYLHQYLKGFEKIVHWWADRQHADGQVGGGWNDDVLFVSRLPGPFLYTGDAPARRMFDCVFEGLEKTGMFRDGYCRIVPIDQMHAMDLVRNRYEGLLFDPGEPNKIKIAMRTAWRFGKPDETPVNYGDAESFRYDHDWVRWYWGQGPAEKAYSTTREAVTRFAKTYAPAMNDVLYFRYTDSGMFIDGFTIPGSAEAKRILVGGECGPFLDNLTLSATWEQGGGPDIPKWIEYASDTKFVAHLYSYAPTEKDVSVRLTRLRKGNYRVTLTRVGHDGEVQTVLTKQTELRRFSTVTIPVRPGREYALTIELESVLPDPGPLPDLAVVAKRLPDGSVEAEVLNFGSGLAGPFAVRAEDADGREIGQESVAGLASAADFVPKSAHLRFQPPANAQAPFRITVDPTNTVEEIQEANNSTTVSMMSSPK